MNYSPIFISACIVQPLRFLFKNYAPEHLRWDEDPMKSQIEIDTINNFHKVAIQTKPRILISRGGYSKSSTGLTDNLAASPGPYVSHGLHEEVKMILVNGMAQVLIQSKQEGTCEVLCEMVEHFIQWTSPMLCDTYGFKSFAFPLQVSPCTPNREDTEIFEISLAAPWVREEHWNISNDAIKLKEFTLTLTD